MGTFELKQNCCVDAASTRRDECIIAYKIFDQCRSQICLTPDIIGSPRAATTSTACGESYTKGDIICPPSNAVSVSIENFCISQIDILSKTPNAFRTGYWDIEIRFVFCYILVFRTSDNTEICCIKANSFYKTKVTLFGSIDTDVLFVSDLYCNTFNTGPYVSVEAKAMPLASALRFSSCGGCGCGCGCGCDFNNNCGCNHCGNVLSSNRCNDCCETLPIAVDVTIGLFFIVKVFRLVNLLVSSAGYCFPEDCTATASAQAPCDFFDTLDFPISIFSPPTSAELTETNNCSCNRRCC